MTSELSKREQVVIDGQPVDFVALPAQAGVTLDRSFTLVWKEHVGTDVNHGYAPRVTDGEMAWHTQYTHYYEPRSQRVTRHEVKFATPEGERTMTLSGNFFSTGDEATLVFADGNGGSTPIAVCNLTKGMIYKGVDVDKFTPAYMGSNGGLRLGRFFARFVSFLLLILIIACWSYLAEKKATREVGMAMYYALFAFVPTYVIVGYKLARAYTQAKAAYLKQVVEHAFRFADPSYRPPVKSEGSALENAA